MEKKCKCGESCDCVSRETYKKALEATAYLANRVKVLEEKYKLALFSNKEKEDFQPPAPPQEEGWGKDAYGKVKAPDNQIKINMVNDLPPGSGINHVVLEDKDTALNDECEACSA
jgi:hypothetical protein